MEHDYAHHRQSPEDVGDIDSWMTRKSRSGQLHKMNNFVDEFISSTKLINISDTAEKNLSRGRLRTSPMPSRDKHISNKTD